MATRDPFDASEMKKEFLSMLECPVCLNTMQKPILVSVNGHNICESCRHKVQICPTCRDTFSNTRNFFAEKTAEKFFTSCKHSSNGCKERMLPEQIAKHESGCSFGSTVECLLGKGEDSVVRCGWKGRKMDLLKHAQQNSEHKTFIWKNYPIKSPIYFSTFTSNYIEVDLIPKDGELFWLFIRYDAVEEKYYEAVQLIGPHEEASRYKYQHELRSNDNEQFMMVRNITWGHSENIETIFRSGKCLVLDYSVFRHYCTKGVSLASDGSRHYIKLPTYCLTIDKRDV